MRLLPLHVGDIDAELRIITGEQGTVTLPIASWLIEHPDGLVLFDNGMHPGLQHDTSRLGRTAEVFVPRYHPGQEVSARLDAAGVDAASITHMVLSHLHFDHAGGTGEVPNARIVIQRDEWSAGHDQRLVEKGIYDPVDFDHGHDVEQIDGDHDLFGDGLITCVPTPGHTVGHQALRVELGSGPVVLTGDCVYFERMLTEMLVPRLGHDEEQQLRSMQHLASLRDEGCRLLYGHDQAQFSALPSDGLR